MDLKQLDTVAAAEKGFELSLNHPSTGEPVNIFITVLGRDSSEFRRVQAEHNRKRVSRTQKVGRAMTLAETDMDSDTIELLSACTKSWRQVVGEGDEATSKDTLTLDGEELACNKANAVRVYREFPWIREQVDIAVVDRGNFIRR